MKKKKTRECSVLRNQKDKMRSHYEIPIHQEEEKTSDTNNFKLEHRNKISKYGEEMTFESDGRYLLVRYISYGDGTKSGRNAFGSRDEGGPPSILSSCLLSLRGTKQTGTTPNGDD